MSTKKVLDLVNVEPFSPRSISEVNSQDVFFEIYMKAIGILEDILMSTTELAGKDINNIIAFCGDRGSGKTSTMSSFSKILSDIELKHKLLSVSDLGNNIIEKTEFCNGLQIDPSYFDGIHNVVDVLIANMYQKAKEKYCELQEKTNQANQYNNISAASTIKEDYRLLISSFSDVYKKISLMVDTNRVLEAEYDYSGDLAKLARLGQSLGLKESLHTLINNYLDFMGFDSKKDKLIIEIDDVDLCSKNVFQIVEQIRKYLMQTNVILLIGIKFEQFDMCLQEKYLEDYKNLLSYSEQNEKGNIFNDVIAMARAYELKLIPDVRRLNLSDVYIGPNTHIKTDSNVNQDITLEKFIREIIVNATGVALSSAEISTIIPSNLRAAINMVQFTKNLTGKMDSDPNNYPNNVNQILGYIKNAVIWGNIYRKNISQYIKLIDSDYHNMDEILKMSFAKFMYDNHLSSSSGMLEEKETSQENYNLCNLIYTLKLYLATINDPNALDYKIDYNLWNDVTDIVLTGNNKGAFVNTINSIQLSFDILVKSDTEPTTRFDVHKWLTEDNSTQKITRGSKEVIECLDSQLQEQLAESLLVLLMMTRLEEKPLVSVVNPSFLTRSLHISWSNYIINLTHIDYFIENSGIRYAFGRNTNIIKTAIMNFKAKNKYVIEYFKWLHCNPILCKRVVSLAKRYGDYREKSESRTYGSINQFNKYLLLSRDFSDDDYHNAKTIDISFPNTKSYNTQLLVNDLEKPMKIYANILENATTTPAIIKPEKTLSKFLKSSKTNAKLLEQTEINRKNLEKIQQNLGELNAEWIDDFYLFIEYLTDQAGKYPSEEFSKEDYDTYIRYKELIDKMYESESTK